MFEFRLDFPSWEGLGVGTKELVSIRPEATQPKGLGVKSRQRIFHFERL
jgi:hypothetical protein